LPLNKPLFDRFLVVTDTKDRRTRDLCEHHHVECLATDAFYEGDKAFDKGAGISEGLKRLSKRDWVVHLDADIALPPRSRSLLEKMRLDPLCLYGIDRLMCGSFEDWTGYVAQPEVQHSCDIYVQANAFPLGTRIARMNDDGYLPLGFFQMWNPAETGIVTYPSHGRADRSDLCFASKWPRRHRALIPEIVGIHLASEDDSEMGANWRGRVTPAFGPQRRHHHHHHHKHRYGEE
jgi:hypothetical protein